jgi:hypothetical protein
MGIVQMKPVWGIVLVEGLEAIRNCSNETYGRHSIPSPAYGFPPQRILRTAPGTTPTLTSLSEQNQTFRDRDNTVSAQCYCGSL